MYGKQPKSVIDKKLYKKIVDDDVQDPKYSTVGETDSPGEVLAVVNEVLINHGLEIVEIEDDGDYPIAFTVAKI